MRAVRLVTRLLRRSPFQVGMLLVVVVALGGWALFEKPRISVGLARGTELQAEFDRGYRLRPYVSKVKIAGVPVGVVTSSRQVEGRAAVTMKLDDKSATRLGSHPTAHVRPTTLLGGTVYVELAPGGRPGTPEGPITLERTSVPVELDRVLDALDRDARRGVQALVGRSDEMLRNGGRRAIAGLLDSGADAFVPMADVLQAARGTDAGDLSRAIEQLAAVSADLTDESDSTRIGRLVDAARPVARTLGERSELLAETVAQLPVTLGRTDAGLAELDRLLVALEATAPDARATLVEADRLLTRLRPVVADARPVVADLRALLGDVQPLLDDLAPVVADLTGIVDDIDGDVARRLAGPVAETLNRPHRGSDSVMYEEIGYMLTGLAGFSMGVDEQGTFLNFAPGLAPESLGGLGIHGVAPGGYDPPGGLPATDVPVDPADPPPVGFSPSSSAPRTAALGTDGTAPSAGGGTPASPPEGHPLEVGSRYGADAPGRSAAPPAAPAPREAIPATASRGQRWIPWPPIVILGGLALTVLVTSTRRRRAGSVGR